MHFITRKHLSRRTALKGLGVVVGLPLLDAMIPAATALAKVDALPKVRTGFFYMPHGAIMGNTAYGPKLDNWTPSGAGADFKLSNILAPLEHHKRYVTSFSNLVNAACAGSVHTINPATWLSDVRPDQTSPSAQMATTLDQVIAARLGRDTNLSSLEVASENTIQVAACGTGAGRCYYSSTTSFSSPTMPLPMEYNPRKVFLELFGEGDTPAERVAIARETGSLLDLIADRTQALQARLGSADRAILGNYLDTVREVERRVQKSQSNGFGNVQIPDAPAGELERFDQQVKLMFDLVALAYQANLTRVASYIMVAEGTNRTYNHIGVPDAFHPLSHHANDMGRINKLIKVQRWHVQMFAQFLDRLAAIPEGNGTLLDNALFMYGSNMSNSDKHNNYPLPNILVGGAGGALKGGQHIDLPEHTPLANLHLTVLHKLGLEQPSFGDSTGIIAKA
ncbi:MAG TPA: DUF1552 domain-containing protein [Steroidobacteraceae bacterium]|nr:DUF1552 domain-containing protein [Steroidobacteraceae bacterium]